MEPYPVHAAAMTLWAKGYGYDEISDRLLAGATCEGGAVTLGGVPYRAVVVPAYRTMPPATLRTLTELAEAGATVVVHKALPADIPGLGDLEKQRAELKGLSLIHI